MKHFAENRSFFAGNKLRAPRPRPPISSCKNAAAHPRASTSSCKNAAARPRPSISSCKMQRLIRRLRRAPAKCSGSSAGFDKLLQNAAAHPRASTSSCKMQRLIRRLRQAPAKMQRLIRRLRRAPAKMQQPIRRLGWVAAYRCLKNPAHRATLTSSLPFCTGFQPSVPERTSSMP